MKGDITMSVEKLVNNGLRRIGNVHPVVKQGAKEIIRRAYKEGIYVSFSAGYRSNVEQEKLYAQGRFGNKDKIVTNARGGQSLHNYGLALDMFITNKEGTTASWNVSDLRRVAKIAKSLGFEWGGDWKTFKDYPHLQMTGGLTIAQLQKGQKPRISLKGISAAPSTVKPHPQTKPTTSPSGNLGLVDYMRSKGMDSSYHHRAKLAKQYGIANYKGTAKQNESLLAKLTTSKSPTNTQNKIKKGNQTTNSVVTYLNSINADSSYANRAKLAAKYGINNYKGTISQNVTLLSILRSKSASTKKAPTKTESLVNYLQSIHVDSSYHHRANLAKKYGIKNYKGTATQNTQLLKKLKG